MCDNHAFGAQPGQPSWEPLQATFKPTTGRLGANGEPATSHPHATLLPVPGRVHQDARCFGFRPPQFPAPRHALRAVGLPYDKNHSRQLCGPGVTTTVCLGILPLPGGFRWPRLSSGLVAEAFQASTAAFSLLRVDNTRRLSRQQNNAVLAGYLDLGNVGEGQIGWQGDLGPVFEPPGLLRGAPVFPVPAGGRVRRGGRVGDHNRPEGDGGFIRLPDRTQPVRSRTQPLDGDRQGCRPVFRLESGHAIRPRGRCHWAAAECPYPRTSGDANPLSEPQTTKARNIFAIR